MVDRFSSRPAPSGLRHKSIMSASARPMLACLAAAILSSASFTHKSLANESKERPANTSSPAWVAQMHYVMGTMLEVQMPNAASNRQLFASLFDIARRHDEVFSAFKPDSPLSHCLSDSQSRRKALLT
jgi:thiamine biosynthesis lipoprotein ApbE